jgi:hypothetical protein
MQTKRLLIVRKADCGSSLRNDRVWAAILLLLVATVHFSLHAQVSIGGLADPVAGALLDLNKTVKDGLVLSNVSLSDLSKIPATGFAGITAEQEDNSALLGMMVYNTNPTTGVGVYIWNGTNWMPAGENCLPAESLNLRLTPPASPVFEGNSIFSISSDAGARCAEGEVYIWEKTGKDDNAFAPFKTTAYPESNTTVPFSESGTYKVRVQVANSYSSSTAISNEVTVNVEPVAYYLTGKPCYDVNQNTDNRGIETTADVHQALAANFNAATNRIRTYCFHHGPTVIW